jgi:hypothetical protein
MCRFLRRHALKKGFVMVSTPASYPQAASPGFQYPLNNFQPWQQANVPAHNTLPPSTTGLLAATASPSQYGTLPPNTPNNTPGQKPESLLEILPSPREFAMGSVAGLALLPIFNRVNREKGALERLAMFLDRQPGIHWAGQKMDKAFRLSGHAFLKQDWVRNLTFADAVVPEGASKKMQERASLAAIHRMESYQLAVTMAQLNRYFPDKSGSQGRNLRATYQHLFPGQAGSSSINLLKPETVKNKGFQVVIQDLEGKIKMLSARQNKTRDERFILKRLTATHSRLRGLNGLYKPSFESAAVTTARLSAKGTGFAGRMIKGVGLILQQNFSGATAVGGRMGVGANPVTTGGSHAFAQKTVWSGLKQARGFLLPAIFGLGMILATSIHRYNKAKPGEKKAAFFHDFLGFGVGNLVGWELGRRFLTGVGFSRVFGKQAARIVLPLANWTLGGVATELTAMFLVAGQSQKLLEKVSHVFFGTPSKESLGETEETVPPAPAATTTTGLAASPAQQQASQSVSPVALSSLTPVAQLKSQSPFKPQFQQHLLMPPVYSTSTTASVASPVLPALNRSLQFQPVAVSS